MLKPDTSDFASLTKCSHWLSIRDEVIEFKGKGTMKTYWCEPNAVTESATESDLQESECPPVSASSPPDVFVDWNTDTLLELLQDVVWQREIANGRIDRGAESPFDESPSFGICARGADQLRDYVSEIAKLYHAHEFHNFEHASHVVMTTSLLLKRMSHHGKESSGDRNCGLLDPLTRFALVFAALIHDVDHPGVSNAQLVLEQNALSVEYNGQSVAEQHSLDVAWGLLLEPQFAQLRECLFASHAEQEQFRSVVVNAVLATDLFDQELNARREMQWEKHFGAGSTTSNWDGCEGEGDGQDKLTAVADLVLRVADVSHTMQHFVIYRKWNSRLLAEMYAAFAAGRAAQDPTIGWYEGELWFFDHYVIPLATKLCTMTSGLFGTASNDFLQYALDNRAEWEMRGRCLVDEAHIQFK
jgi:3'5'-cyclic nucleotide phosphodiesterase